MGLTGSARRVMANPSENSVLVHFLDPGYRGLGLGKVTIPNVQTKNDLCKMHTGRNVLYPETGDPLVCDLGGEPYAVKVARTVRGGVYLCSNRG
jgi:hypothetical protein